MARDPAYVLAERHYNATHRTGDTWAGLAHGDPARDRYLEVAHLDLDALDAAGYEVRPKAEEGVVTLDGEPWRFIRDAVHLPPHNGIKGYAVPVTDGDDQPDHRGEPEGDPSP